MCYWLLVVLVCCLNFISQQQQLNQFCRLLLLSSARCEILQFEKSHRSTFQQIKDISICIFTTHITSICEKKNFGRSTAWIIIKNKCLYKISSINEKNYYFKAFAKQVVSFGCMIEKKCYFRFLPIFLIKKTS